MASKLSQGLGEQVTCPICLEHYSDPRLLPCLHTYCRHCLEDLLAKGTSKEHLVCPECREQVQVLSRDVTKLKVNFLINNLLSLLAIHSVVEEKDGQTELTCENCDSKEAAKGRCVNCCMFLCNFCSTAHQRYLATKDHQLMTLDELKDKGIPVIEKQLFCTKHKGEVKKLYCNTCQELICRDCTIIDHRDHKFSFIEDVADEHKKIFKRETIKACNTKSKIDEVLTSVQEMKENVKKTSQATEKEVDDFIDKQIKALNEKRITLKEETRRIAAGKIKELRTQEDGLVMHMTGLRSAIEFTEKVLNSGGNNDVLSMAKQVTSRLSQLSDKPFKEKPCQDIEMKLRVDEQLFRDYIKNCIVVDASIPDPTQCSVVQLVNGNLIEIQNMIFTTHGQVLEFVVRIKNSLGDNLRFMEDRIEAKVEGAMARLQIKSLKNNTYSFVVTFTNHCNIRVMIDGYDMKGSPFSVQNNFSNFPEDDLLIDDDIDQLLTYQEERGFYEGKPEFVYQPYEEEW